MHHIFIAPHPDDAVLSCGGLIYQLARAGERVTVVTVMAGPLPPDVVISPFIAEHLVRWGLGPDPVPGRRDEDRRALELLGAHVILLDFPDALYRTDGHAVPLYPDLERLFGAVHPRDPLVRHPAILAVCDPAATIYAPLGAGQHVDHQLVREAVCAALERREFALFLYEEYPYSAGGAAVVNAAREALPWATQSSLVRLDEQALMAKTQAIACYTSQISTFWDGVEQMAGAVREYARQVGGEGYAERLWHRA